MGSAQDEFPPVRSISRDPFEREEREHESRAIRTGLAVVDRTHVGAVVGLPTSSRARSNGCIPSVVASGLKQQPRRSGNLPANDLDDLADRGGGERPKTFSGPRDEDPSRPGAIHVGETGAVMISGARFHGRILEARPQQNSSRPTNAGHFGPPGRERPISAWLQPSIIALSISAARSPSRPAAIRPSNSNLKGWANVYHLGQGSWT